MDKKLSEKDKKAIANLLKDTPLPLIEFKPRKKTKFNMERVPLPPSEISTVNPWERVIERMQRCKESIDMGHVNLAEVFYFEIKPFYNRLNFYQQNELYPYLQELQQNMNMLMMKKVKNSLKRH